MVFHAQADTDVKRASVNATSSGNTQIVALVANKKIRVLWVLATNRDVTVVNVKFQSNTTDISGAHQLAVSGGGFSLNAAPGYYCQTVAGQALNVNLSGNSDVLVDVGYLEVT